MNKRRKVFWGIATVLLIAVGAFAYWWFFMREAPAVSGTTGGTFPEGEFGGVGGEFGAGDFGFLDEDTGEGPRLRQLTTEPVAGAVIFARGGETLVRYAVRGTGHFFEQGVDDATAVRISNQTIPEISEALWRPDGLGVIVRYPKEIGGTEQIESFYTPVSATAKEGDALRASFLPRNIRTLAFSPTGNTLFYLAERSDGSDGILSGPDGTRRSTLVSLSLKDLTAAWNSNNELFLTSRASAGVVGYAFSVGTQTGALELVEEGEGFTTLPNRTGEYALVGEAGEQGIGVTLRHLDDARNIALGIATLTDKCVWGKKNRNTAYCTVPRDVPRNFPDSWYQGVAATEDSLWVIDAETGRASVAVVLDGGDALNLDISPDDSHIIFQNKNDLTLWLLEL